MLAKVVAVAMAPLGTALLLGLLGWLLIGSRSPHTARRGRRLLLVAGLWLTVWSLPVVSESLRGAWEARAGERMLDRLPPAAAMRPPRRPRPWPDPVPPSW